MTRICFFLFRLRRDAVVSAQDIGSGQSPARLNVRIRSGCWSPGKCLWRPHDHARKPFIHRLASWMAVCCPSFCLTTLELPQQWKESTVVPAAWWPRDLGLSPSRARNLSFHYSIQTGISSLVSNGYRGGGIKRPGCEPDFCLPSNAEV
jgi:hypothetical protein